MVKKKSNVKIDEKSNEEVQPIQVKAMYETSPVVEVEDGVDIYCVLGNTRYQFVKHISPFYSGEEYMVKATFTKDSEVCFVHKDGRKIPVHENSNCGYTLVGKAKALFEAKKSLCANGEASDDQEYVFINQHSSLYYIGETGEHSLFIRVYDNLNGIENDRWVVIYID